jgi:hypothetical protein
LVRRDRREQCGHLVGRPSWNGVTDLVADLIEMVGWAALSTECASIRVWAIGAIALTLMLCSAPSAASTRVKPTNPVFAAP